MATVTRSRDYDTDDTLTAAFYDADLDEIVDGVNDITNAQINASAAIAQSKLANATTTYVGKNRATPGSVDLDKDGTEDSWTDWDISSIVGSAAVLVNLWVRVRDDTVGSYMAFRENGETGVVAGREMIPVTVQVVNQTIVQSIWVITDSSGILEYTTVDAGGTAIAQARATVKFWLETQG